MPLAFGRIAAAGLAVSMFACRAAAADPLRVTTADGQGADSTIASAPGAPSGGDRPELRVVFKAASGGGTASEKAYLRFDLSKVAGSRVTAATLVLQPLSAGFDWDVNVFALRELTRSAPATVLDGRQVKGDESPGGARQPGLAWADAPGNDASVGGGYVDSANAAALPGVNADAVEYLGRLSAPAGGRQARFTSRAILDHLNADTDGLVTFMLTRADRGPTSTAFASKEHAALDPPTLLLELAPAAREQTADRLLRRPLQLGVEAKRLETVWRDVELTARKRKSWKGVLAQADALVRILESGGASGREKRSESQALGLARLLRLEAGLRAKEIDEVSWAKSAAEVLNARPADAPSTILAFLSVAGWRTVDGGSFEISAIDFKPLVDAGAPDGVRFEVARAREYPAGRVPKDPKVAVGFFRRFLSTTDGTPTDPFVLHRYATLLGSLRGNDATAALLDEVAALNPNQRVGVAAALMAITREPDPAARDSRIVAEVESNPQSPLAAALRTRYLTIVAERGDLAPALEIVAQGPGAPAGNPRERATQIRKLITHVPAPGAFDWHGPGAPPQFELERVGSESALLAAAAEADWAAGRYPEAAELAFLSLRSQGVFLRNLTSGKPAASLDDLGHEAKKEDAQALAALVLGSCAAESDRPADSRTYLDLAAKASAGPLRAYALFLLAKQRMQSEALAAGAADAKAALALVPKSVVLAALDAAASDVASQEAALRNAVAAIDEVWKTASAEADPERSQLAYFKAAEMATAIGHTERAVAIYLAMVERHPAGDKAEDALKRCVQMLTARAAPGDAGRAAKYQRMLDRPRGKAAAGQAQAAPVGGTSTVR